MEVDVFNAICGLENILGDVKNVKEDTGDLFKREMEVCEKYVTRALKSAYRMRLKELNSKAEKEEEVEKDDGTDQA